MVLKLRCAIVARQAFPERLKQLKCWLKITCFRTTLCVNATGQVFSEKQARVEKGFCAN